MRFIDDDEIEVRGVIQAGARLRAALVHGVHHDGRRRENDVRLFLFAHVAQEIDERHVGQQHAELLVCLVHKLLTVGEIEHLADRLLIEERVDGAHRHARLARAGRRGNEEAAHAPVHVLADVPDGFPLIRAVRDVVRQLGMRLGIVAAAKLHAPLQVGAREAAVNRAQLVASFIEEPILSFALEEDEGAHSVLLLQGRRPRLRPGESVFQRLRRCLDRHDGKRLLLGVREEEVDGRRLLSLACDLFVHEEILAQRPARLRTVNHDAARTALGQEVGRHRNDAAVPGLFARLRKRLRRLAVLFALRQQCAAVERLLVKRQELQRLRIRLLAARRQEIFVEGSRRETFLVARRHPGERAVEGAEREHGFLARDSHAAVGNDIAEVQDVGYKGIQPLGTQLLERRLVDEPRDRLAVRQRKPRIVREHPAHRQLHRALRQDHALRI